MTGQHRFLARSGFTDLLALLQGKGYRCVGPQVRDGAIVYQDLHPGDALPQGWHDSQEPGQYTLSRDDSPRWFAWANGPQAIKPQLFASREPMWNMHRGDDGGLQFQTVLPQPVPVAVIGARACDVAALAIHDQHFLHEQRDHYYHARREGLLLVVVNCSHPASTCFCVSTGDGPIAADGFDLLLDELDEGFLIQAGSETGAEVLTMLSTDPVQPGQVERVSQQQQHAVSVQQRRLPEGDLSQRLYDRLEHPRWAEVATRCLSCGNCTMVCPTCFCHSHGEEPAMDGVASTHFREWDSCFTDGHSYIHGIVVRAETRLRYRQWLTHKLGGWHEQYGRSGCVGCGRCITWCPVGIDITEEAAAVCAD